MVRRNKGRAEGGNKQISKWRKCGKKEMIELRKEGRKERRREGGRKEEGFPAGNSDVVSLLHQAQ